MIEQFRRILSDAEANFNRAYSDWQHRAGDGAFLDAKRKFERFRTELNEIPATRARALDQLMQNQRKLQLDHFLDKSEIEDAKIESIGPGRKRTLESYGIETAKDIVAHRISAVPGFGPKLAARLVRWRRSIEAKFVFDPTKGIDPRDIAKVEQDILALRIRTMASAKAAHADAMQTHPRIMSLRHNTRPWRQRWRIVH